MIQELRPLLRFFRLVRALDRINRNKNSKDEFVSKDHVEAARTLATAKYKSITKAYDYEGVHPDIIEFWKAFDKHCKKRNIPLWAFEFVRSKKRQDALHAKGRSKARGGQSPHQVHRIKWWYEVRVKQPDGTYKMEKHYEHRNYSMAVDIVHASRAWNLTKKEWDVLGSIGKEIARKRNLKMEWGGDWKFYDPAHWQIKNWRDLLD